MAELLKTARSAGHQADYVLFDTWFSGPAQLFAVKALGPDSIAMIRTGYLMLAMEQPALFINMFIGHLPVKL